MEVKVPYSLTRIPVKVYLEDVGEFKGEFIRFHAPSTIRELLKLMPLEGFAAKWDYAVYFQINFKRGAEKIVSKISPGDILYWPPGPYIVLSFRESFPPAQIVKIGEMKEGVGEIFKVKHGSRIRITLVIQ